MNDTVPPTDLLERASMAVSDTVDQAADLGHEAALRSVDYVNEHPWRAIGMGAAAGFVVGWFMRRR
jgi:ElaB/YqjD/DUF883 family membrane-anchored ribosome-binding protein